MSVTITSKKPFCGLYERASIMHHGQHLEVLGEKHAQSFGYYLVIFRQNHPES